jgi:hypothetical protein
MFTTIKKRILILSIASLVLLALIVGPGFVSSARAGYLAQSAGENNLTIAYPGQLTGDDGKAVADGNYDFTFTLYDAATDGNLLWSETQTGVTVRNGSFGVLLGGVNPLPEMAFTTRLWLSVSVRGPQTENFVELTPRQLLDEIAYVSPDSPSAVTGTCAHDHFLEQWVGNTTSYGLRIETTGSGDGIRGVTVSTLPSYGGVYGINNSTSGQGAGVSAYANSSAGYGLYATNGPGTAVYGTSTSGIGVMGRSTSNDGIRGTTAATGMSGIYGYADNSFGVTGQSTNSFGVQARGNDATGDDTFGDIWLDGARGEILTGERLNLTSNWNVNIDLDYDNNDLNGAFRIYANNVITPVFSIDEVGNMIAMGAKSAEVMTLNNGPRLLYAIESPEVWFEDIGSAVLDEGKIEVAIEPIFAQTVNLEDYQVFLTPISDVPAILYVVTKSPSSFIVQGVTLDGKPASCSFDYRIVAKRLGYENVRLQQPAKPEGEIK